MPTYRLSHFVQDRLVLTPRNFEEPYIAHTDLASCTRYNQALCNQFHLPNLEPYIHKTEGKWRNACRLLPLPSTHVISLSFCNNLNFHIHLNILHINFTQCKFKFHQPFQFTSKLTFLSSFHFLSTFTFNYQFCAACYPRFYTTPRKIRHFSLYQICNPFIPLQLFSWKLAEI